jgi:hypothetical protein
MSVRIHTKTVFDIESGDIFADDSYEYVGPIASCDPNSGAIRSGAMANSTSGQGISRTGQNNAASLYGTLNPTLSTMATNPQGINPADMAKIQTSNMQTAGGANAGAVGQGSLLAARTKNAGTADSAIAKSGEAASQNLSKANLATQNENQQLKTKQQSEGLNGLQGLYGTNESAAVGGLNASNNALKTASDIQPFWQKLVLQGLSSAGTAAGGYLNGKQQAGGDSNGF